MSPTHSSAFLVLLASSCLVLSETGAVYQSIRVLKCCRNGETLVREGEEEIGHCVPTDTPWQPLVYSPVVRDWVGIPKKWIIEEGAKPVCTDGVLTHVSGSSTSPFIFFDTGHVTLNGNIEEQYEPDKYCADEQGLLLCQPRSAMPKPKLRRCCGSDAHLYENNITCVSQKGASNLTVILGNATHVDITNDFPSCKSHLNYTIVGDMRNATILSDGGLEYEDSFIPPEKFCLQSGLEDGLVKVVACSEYARHIPIVVAAADIRFTLYPIGFLISVVFLAATLAAGWLLPAAHHVLHWRCQTHHVACLMLGDLLMAIIQLASDSLNIWVCKGVAIAAHFFFLSAFFWLNTMCFNIWWTFRDLRPASLEKGQETVRLRVYACYAWGGPLLVAGLAALFDHLPPQPDYTFLKPRFGEAKCWFFGDMEILTYFFGPVGVLLAINLMLFAATARELTCGLWKREVVKSTTERAALGRVCMKLVVVMGVTWVADIVSWAAGGPKQVWYITDFINAVQGVFIFVVVGCQPQVWAALKRLCNRHPRSNVGRQGNAMSTTSHGMPSMGDSVTQNPSTKTAPLETIC